MEMMIVGDRIMHRKQLGIIYLIGDRRDQK
jgi:hypothetical protein